MSQGVNIILKLVVAVVCSVSILAFADENTNDPTRAKGRGVFNTTFIGSVGNPDMLSHIHVFNLLRSHGIGCWIYGSLMDGIAVKPVDAARACELLIEDAKKNSYLLWIDDPPMKFAATGVVVSINTSITQMLTNEMFAATNPVGKFIRSEPIVRATRKYPFVLSVEIGRRMFMATTNEWRQGFDVRIVLASSPDASNRHLQHAWYQFDFKDEHIRFLQIVDGVNVPYDYRIDHQRWWEPQPAAGALRHRNGEAQR